MSTYSSHARGLSRLQLSFSPSPSDTLPSFKWRSPADEVVGLGWIGTLPEWMLSLSTTPPSGSIISRQLELAEASSMAVICRLASAPLPWVQWLSGKSVRLVIGKLGFNSKLDPCGFFFLSPKLTSVMCFFLGPPCNCPPC